MINSIMNELTHQTNIPQVFRIHQVLEDMCSTFKASFVNY